MPVIMKDNVQYAYTTKGTVFHTLSNAEYEALSEEEKMNGDVYCIPDREPILNPDEVWAKIGTETLDIGDDLTDGVNQINSRLIKFKTLTGTTDASGNFQVLSSDIDMTTDMLIMALPNRYDSNYETGFYTCKIGVNPTTNRFIINCYNDNTGTKISNTAVKVTAVYVSLN